MKRPWCVHTLDDMIGPPYRNASVPYYTERETLKFKSVRSVPAPFKHSRIAAAWYVLIGVAVAVEWPKAGELEAALFPEELITPKACVFECRTHNGSMFGAGRAWCQTHGFDCPELASREKATPAL